MPRLHLVAERLEHGGRRPDEHGARLGDGARERRPLAQEAVAGVHRLRARPRARASRIASTFRYESFAGAGPTSTASSASVTCGASRSASEYTATVRDPEAPAGAHHAAGDLAAVGDQDLFERLLLGHGEQVERIGGAARPASRVRRAIAGPQTWTKSSGSMGVAGWSLAAAAAMPLEPAMRHDERAAAG